MPHQPPPLPDAEPEDLAPGVRVGPGILRFAFSSSSGPGGQNVNKRATKTELRVRLIDLPIPADARHRLVTIAGQRVTADGELIITSDEHRSQGQNRAECLARLRELLVRAMARPRKRRPTRPSRGSIERRLTAKRATGERKRRRASGGGED
jgi:ribosome-associated protein